MIQLRRDLGVLHEAREPGDLTPGVADVVATPHGPSLEGPTAYE